jgi:hypothetical protein
MVRHHELHLREANALDSDTSYDLLIGEREEQLSDDFRFVGGAPDFAEDQNGREEKGNSSCDDEG